MLRCTGAGAAEPSTRLMMSPDPIRTNESQPSESASNTREREHGTVNCLLDGLSSWTQGMVISRGSLFSSDAPGLEDSD